MINCANDLVQRESLMQESGEQMAGGMGLGTREGLRARLTAERQRTWWWVDAAMGTCATFLLLLSKQKCRAGSKVTGCNEVGKGVIRSLGRKGSMNVFYRRMEG